MVNLKIFFQNPIKYIVHMEEITFLVICIVTLSIGMILFSIWLAENSRDVERGIFIRNWTILLGAVVIFFNGLLWSQTANNTVAYVEKINQVIEEQYCVYINGIEMDMKNVDLYSYSNIKYDDENKKVIITID